MNRTFWSLLEDSLFPPRCAGCGSDADTNRFPLCSKCTQKISLHNSFFCPSCGNRIVGTKNHCHPAEPYLLGAATDFNHPIIQKLVHALKYDGWRTTAAPLGVFLATYISSLNNANNFFPIDILVPVPIHKKKYIARGYNQSLLIARAFVTALGAKSAKIDDQILVKSKETPSQTTCVTVSARRENVANAFSVIAPEKILNKNIAVIDDVHTSGATMHEIAHTLKAHGAKRILALTFAKT